MPFTRIIAEIGSTHDGKRDSCFSAIETASKIGIKDVKFQMLDKSQEKCGNISIKREWLRDLVRAGIDNGVNVFASCWSIGAMETCLEAGATTMKMAYSERKTKYLIDYAMANFKEVIISGDCMTSFPEGAIKLYCIPLYPVPYCVSFEGLFPRFDGFSDHTLGIHQSINASIRGAGIIEKHVKENCDSKTPDAQIAVNWEELDQIKYAINRFWSSI